jgi:hypothetical protein
VGHRRDGADSHDLALSHRRQIGVGCQAEACEVEVRGGRIRTRQEIGVNPGFASLTGLLIFTPQGESDVFSGAIDGKGGTISMTGDGSISLGSVNSSGSGLFDLNVTSGSLLLNGVLNAQKLFVGSGARFGGPATMNFSGPVQFNSGAALLGLSSSIECNAAFLPLSFDRGLNRPETCYSFDSSEKNRA